MKRKMLTLPGFLIIGILFAFQTGPDRIAHFPKKIEYVKVLPHPDSLYVFLMAGQSNMAGRGWVQPQDTLPDPRILTIDKELNWICAKEPLHFYTPRLSGLDCGMSFARTLLDSLPAHISIAMIPCAVGGSSVEQWLYNATHRGVALLDNFKGKVNFAAEHGTIKGILWHQGEGDAKSSRIPFYHQRLDSLFHLFRTHAGDQDLPVVMGELGPFARSEEIQSRWDSINTIIHQLAGHQGNMAVIETGDLFHKGDSLHFDSGSQRKMGERYALKYLEITR